MLLTRLDTEYLRIALENSETEPKGLVEVLRSHHDPKTNAAAIAAWLALSRWVYDTTKSISENVRD